MSAEGIEWMADASDAIVCGGTMEAAEIWSCTRGGYLVVLYQRMATSATHGAATGLALQTSHAASRSTSPGRCLRHDDDRLRRNQSDAVVGGVCWMHVARCLDECGLDPASYRWRLGRLGHGCDVAGRITRRSPSFMIAVITLGYVGML